MDLSSFESVIQFAIKREEEAIKGYSDMSEIAKEPGLKKLLLELKKEEENHKKLLQGLSKKEIETYEDQQVEDLKISDYLVEEPLDEEMNFQDLLVFAAKKEQKAVELYSGLACMMKDPELKKLFEFMVEQEKSHKLKLETEYEKHVMEWD